MKTLKITSIVIGLFSIFNLNTVQAQSDSLEIVPSMKLSGPRFGMTMITPGRTADRLENNFDVSPAFSQFGWQFETRFFTLENGTAGLVETVVLIGGLEQNKFLPSASLLVGIRNANGLELGFGPNLSLSGAGFVIAGGFNVRSGNINFPINIAVAPSTDGTRISMLFGFNARKR